MPKHVTASAPGKLMLFGEHAVVYGHPCLVTAVDQRLRVEIEPNDHDRHQLTLLAPDLNQTALTFDLGTEQQPENLPKEARFVVILVQKFAALFRLQPSLTITTHNEFSSQFGFGSSSAVTVATVVALNELYQTNLTKQEMFALCYQTVLAVQGTGSGFDLAAALWGGTLRFVSGGKVIKPLSIGSLPLVVAYTGVKADTTTLVKELAAHRQKNVKLVDAHFDLIAQITELAQTALRQADWQKVGELMNFNHGLLVGLGVSSAAIEKQRYTLLSQGVVGAKLSGAGGGDCVIGIGGTVQEEGLTQAVEAVGGQWLKVSVNATGARVEEVT